MRRAGGGLNIAFDLLFWRTFRLLRPPKEGSGGHLGPSYPGFLP
jgi:hypothetical protein